MDIVCLERKKKNKRLRAGGIVSTVDSTNGTEKVVDVEEEEK